MFFEGVNLLILSTLAAGYFLMLYLFSPLGKALPAEGALSQKPKTRVGFFDFAKGAAILAIIVIHSCYFLPVFSSEFNFFSQVAAEQINRAMRFAIPVFFISSGALLFLKDLSKNSLKNFYLKKLKRIALPYVLFSLFCTYVFSFFGDFDFFNYLRAAIKDVFTGGALIPYWFIPVLFQLYIAYPFLWYLLEKKRKNPAKVLMYSFFVSLISYFLLSYKYLGWQRYLGEMSFFGPALFLFVFGMIFGPLLLSRNRQKMKIPGFIVFVPTIVLLYFLLGLIAPTEGYYNNRLVYGPVVFLFLFYIYPFFEKIKISAFFEGLGKKSLYIYLLHFLVFYLIAPFSFLITEANINPVLLVFGLSLVNFVITVLLIKTGALIFDMASRIFWDLKFAKNKAHRQHHTNADKR